MRKEDMSKLEDALECFEKATSALADLGHVEEAWAMRGFIDGLMLGAPDADMHNDANYGEDYRAGFTAGDAYARDLGPPEKSRRTAVAWN
jgi:hypothetical protein